MKRKRRTSTSSRTQSGTWVFWLVLLGIGLFGFFLFREDLFRGSKPEVAKKKTSAEEPILSDKKKAPAEKSILPDKKGVVLYFADDDEAYLIGEKREILRRETVEEEARELLSELIKGPKGKMIPTVPPHVRVIDLEMKIEGVARANFNQALSKDHPGGSSAEIMTVYSIVNSLTANFPQIKQVQILEEGKEVETIAGHLSLRKPISPNLALLKRNDKNRRND
jgi:spore germination protein GerM